MSAQMHQILSRDDMNLLTNFASITDDEVVSLKTMIINYLKENFNVTVADIKLSMERIPQNTSLKLEGYGVHILENNNITFRVDIDKNGILRTIYQCFPIDVSQIRKMCQLTKFPAKINETYILEYVENNILLRNILTNETKPVSVISLYSRGNTSYHPLNVDESYKRTHNNSDGFIFMPEHDVDGKYALVLNRYCVGMNVCCAYLDIAACTLKYWYCPNYDYPVGIALRKVDGDVEIYVDNDEIDKKIIYHNNSELPQLVCMWNCYTNSSWCKFNCKQNFNQLLDFDKFITNNLSANITTYNEYISKLEADGFDALHNGKYIEAINYYAKILEIMTESSKRKTNVLYNIACGYAMLNDKEVHILDLPMQA